MTPDRIFLDANVLFSLAYGSHGLDRLWELQKKGHRVLLASGYVVEEARHNLTEANQRKKLESFLSDVDILLEADPSMECPVALPEKDRPVLMAAISAGGDYLLTGDVQHFGKYFGKSIMGVKVCMVRDYLVKSLRPGIRASARRLQRKARAT